MRFVRPVVAFLLLLLSAVPAIHAADPAPLPSASPAPLPLWPGRPSSQLIFFAVLEGLYLDGVPDEVVDRIVPPDDRGESKFDQEHFVYACPLCHPAFEAFRLYRQRKPFHGLKNPPDTFGRGLEASLVGRLKDRDASVRRAAIQDLIGRWVKRRLDMMRLSEAEQAAIRDELERGRKEGMEMLQRLPGLRDSRDSCPICDGSFTAGGGSCAPRRTVAGEAGE